MIARNLTIAGLLTFSLAVAAPVSALTFKEVRFWAQMGKCMTAHRQSRKRLWSGKPRKMAKWPESREPISML